MAEPIRMFRWDEVSTSAFEASGGLQPLFDQLTTLLRETLAEAGDDALELVGADLSVGNRTVTDLHGGEHWVRFGSARLLYRRSERRWRYDVETVPEAGGTLAERWAAIETAAARRYAEGWEVAAYAYLKLRVRQRDLDDEPLGVDARQHVLVLKRPA